MKLSNKQKVVAKLKTLANPKNVEGMAKYGINPKGTLGVSVPALRKIAKEVGKNHDLALELWETGIHEARMLAGFIADPQQLTRKQMEKWVKDFDSWDVCDQVCSNLFDRTPFAYPKAKEWSERKSEFVKRAGFVLMASLSVHDKKAADKDFLQFFPLIKKHAVDERNFVKKAVNWALRQIGKRNSPLHRAAIKLGEEIKRIDSRAAHWIANDALRELKNRLA